jgi:dihydrofolate reductase
MRLSLIWAMTRNRVIGRNNALPWHLPDEMRHFVRTTRGKPVIMGRRQWESMDRALPRRTNIVLTRQAGFRAHGAIVAADFETALQRARAAAEAAGADEIMVIGGAEIYALALPRADRLYQTIIDAELTGDTFFPEIDLCEWEEVAREDHPSDRHHAYAFRIQVLDRKQRGAKV